MNRFIMLVGLASAAVIGMHGAAQAAEQVMPTKFFLVTNPTGGPAKRKMVFKVGQGAPDTVVGNPSLNGATLEVKLGNGTMQCFHLPAAGWVPILTRGYRFTDFTGASGVTKLTIKSTGPNGFVLVIHAAQRRGGTIINVLPQAGTTRFDLNLALGGGDEYCAGGPTPGGSTNTDTVYNVRAMPAPGACGVAACSPSGAFLND